MSSAGGRGWVAIWTALGICLALGGYAWWQQDHHAPAPVLAQANRGSAPIIADQQLEGNRPPAVLVYLCGAVSTPGVYQLAAGRRLIHGLQAAGGARPDADLEQVNLARVLKDGEMVRIPVRVQDLQSHDRTETHTYEIPMHLNQASAQELEWLPGVGPTLAHRIVEYRELHGAFSGVEELHEVPGIGAHLYDQIRPYIIL